jgi:hypothetical protein
VSLKEFSIHIFRILGKEKSVVATWYVSLGMLETKPNQKNMIMLQLASCSLGLSATSQQYFSRRTNQPPATSQQYYSLKTNQHQPSGTSQPNRL